MQLDPVTTEPPPQVEIFRRQGGGLGMRIHGLFEDVYEFGNYATEADIREVCAINHYEIINSKNTGEPKQ